MTADEVAAIKAYVQALITERYAEINQWDSLPTWRESRLKAERILDLRVEDGK